ncbi:MAG: hypothetical protein HY318_18095, partial [Armatimonadetes bacterium]|nr:hypothetical protein [Armatimonadota bacterium]
KRKPKADAGKGGGDGIHRRDDGPASGDGQRGLKLPSGSEAFKGVRILNNLCWELLDQVVEDGETEPLAFGVPMDRWVMIRTEAEVVLDSEARLTIDGDPWPAVVHRKSGTLETMRFLKAGRHHLHPGRSSYGRARITHVTVRAVPALQYAYYGSTYSAISPFGPYDWDFLSQEVLPNVNVMISHGDCIPHPVEIASWKASGRSWISTGRAIWDAKTAQPGDVERAYELWSAAQGNTHPLMDGILIDEIGDVNPFYDVFSQAAERLYQTQGLQGRTFSIYAYRDGVRTDPVGQQFARFIANHGGYVAVEWYLHEYPDREATQKQIDEGLVAKMREWIKVIPADRLVAVLTCATQPTQNTNRCPQANCKVFMDMQMRALATDPAFFSLGGIQQYHTGYSDEETIRWIGRLYRHYGLEGNTEPLSDDPYELRHVQNPDFEEGTRGWTTKPAKSHSVEVRQYKGYGVLQGRWGIPFGDTFLWMKRCAAKPNEISQRIAGLTPGRLYSLKMLTSDYRDLLQGKSDKKQNAVSILLTGVELIEGPKTYFQFTYPHSYGAKWDKFDPQHQYWVNYHYRVFRAKGKTAWLTVSDWRSDSKPGGPVGQELMLNFVEIQPYLE